MNDSLWLLPQPRQLEPGEGRLRLSAGRLIALQSSEPQALRVAAQRLQRVLQTHAELHWAIVAGSEAPPEEIGARISVIPGGTYHPQGYQLSISPAGAHIRAGTPAGALYATMTLCQLIERYGRDLPVLQIRDWPDFNQRGVMLDISRNKVPTLESLFALVDLLASWKINQLQLYTEHTFAYRRHPQVWAEASPLTGEEVLALDAYCRERFIDLVPNQNSFGHMHRWLAHERYRPLAEVPEGGYTTRWGYYDQPLSLCPLDPGSLELVRDLYDELLPHFSSRFFNVGCDETVELGCGRSRPAVAEQGEGRVYLKFLLEIYREVKARGRTMQFWGDIIMEHYELVPELPRDAIALEWGYQADHPFAEHGATFAASGIPFFVCPGTSSWNSIAGRTQNAVGNLRSAAESGLKHGAIGFLNTDWGDNGHWQPLAASYVGYAYGAALSWACQANRELDLAEAVGLYGFGDRSGILGRSAVELGNAYTQTGIDTYNASPLFVLMQIAPEQLAAIRRDGDLAVRERVRSGRARVSWRWIPELQRLRADGLQRALEHIDELAAQLRQAQPGPAPAGLFHRELSWAADMLRHACLRGLWMLGEAGASDEPTLRRELSADAQRLADAFREVWLARNRPGGLSQSLALLQTLARDYDNS